jgi:hypothetical protein
MEFSTDPNVDQVVGEDVIIFSGSPEEVREYLLDNIPRQGCRVWVGASQSFVIGHDYLAS